MPENRAKQENQLMIDPKDLFATIGEMSVELRMVRAKIAELQQDNEKLREHNKQLMVANNTTQKDSQEN